MTFHARAFGAVGDGRHDDTDALQAAIDAAGGGGTLVLEPGVYVAGTLRLRSGLTLRLERGAVLRASEDIARYAIDPTVHPDWLPYYFLWADGCEGLALEGDGVIDGRGPAFWQEEFYSGRTAAEMPATWPVWHYHVRRPRAARPVMAYFARCRDVRVSGLTLRDSPSYTLWFLGCDGVLLRDLTVRNPRTGPNTDVLDLDCSRRVRVSNCDFEAGDDCIALKSDPHRVGTTLACEDIVVDNCVLSCATCAVRVGYEGDAPIRDCAFSNLAIHHARHGVDILSIAPVAPALKIERGTPVDRLSFHNVTMRNVGQALFIWAGNEAPRADYAAHIRNVRISGLTADCVASSWIGAETAGAISGLTLRDVDLFVAEPEEEAPEADLGARPSHWGGFWKAGGLGLRRADGVRLFNVNVATAEGRRPALHWHDMTNLVRDGAELPASGEAW